MTPNAKQVVLEMVAILESAGTKFEKDAAWVKLIRRVRWFNAAPIWTAAGMDSLCHLPYRLNGHGVSVNDFQAWADKLKEFAK